MRGVSASYERKEEDGDKGGKGDKKAAAGTEQEADGARDGLGEIGQPLDAAKAAATDTVIRAKPGATEPADATGKETEPPAKQAEAPAGDAPDENAASPPVADDGAAAREAVEEADVPAAAGAQGGVEAESEFAELLPPHRIESGNPDAPAPPPGKAPPGDSRSFRRYRDDIAEFVLIYRNSSFLITRAGQVGRHGTWSIVEYPTLGTAAHAYAQECSRLTAEGYRDLRS
jgi:hypothetical protein